MQFFSQEELQNMEANADAISKAQAEGLLSTCTSAIGKNDVYDVHLLRAAHLHD